MSHDWAALKYQYAKNWTSLETWSFLFPDPLSHAIYLTMLIVQSAEHAWLVIDNYWPISGSEVVFRWFGDLTNIKPLFILCWPVLCSWISFLIINSSILLSPRSIYRFSINAWLLDHCFIFVRYMFVSYIRIIDGPQLRVYWGALSDFEARTTWIWFFAVS